MSASAPLTVHQFTATSATASCPPGTTLVGGGDLLTSGGNPVPNDGSVTLGVYPGDSNGPVPSGAGDPASWTATAGYSAVTEGNVVVNAYGLCLSGLATSTVVVSQSGTTLGPVTATCPAGSSLVGGGGGYPGFVEASSTDTNNTKLYASYPSDPAGNVPAGGPTDPTAWTVFGNTNQSNPRTLSAYAVCATGVSLSTEVAVVSNGSPVTSGQALPATATCPANSLLLGGGVVLANNPSGVGTGGQGVHVIGDFPTNESGTMPVSSGPAGASWTAIGEDGGQVLNQLATEALALCLQVASQPAAQAISFSPPPTGSVGSTATLAATGGGSGNPVTFRVDPASGAGVCSVSGSTVSFAAAGSCVIDADQAGDSDYQAAAQVSRTITVTNAPTSPTSSSTTTTSVPTPSAPGNGAGTGITPGSGSTPSDGGASSSPPATSTPGTGPGNRGATPSTSTPPTPSSTSTVPPTATTAPATPGAAKGRGAHPGPNGAGGKASSQGFRVSGLLVQSIAPSVSPPIGAPAGGGGTTSKVLVVPHHESREWLWITLAVLAILAGGIWLEWRQLPRLARSTSPKSRSSADGH